MDNPLTAIAHHLPRECLNLLTRDPFMLAMLEGALDDAAGEPCLLCGGPSDGVAAWVPVEAIDGAIRATGGVIGEGRVVLAYAWCVDCRPFERFPEIDRVLLARYELEHLAPAGPSA